MATSPNEEKGVGAARGEPAVAHAFASEGADDAAQDVHGLTGAAEAAAYWASALNRAVWLCDLETAERMLDAGATAAPGAFDQEAGSALWTCALNGQDAWVERILAHAPQAAKTRHSLGRWADLTPLMGAARAVSPRCLELLLPLSDPLAQDLGGRTALSHLADAIHGHFGEPLAECAGVLAPASDGALRDKMGWTALMLAASSRPKDGWRAELIQKMALAGGVAERLSESGDNAMLMAAKSKNFDGAMALWPWCANTSNDKGETALMMAAASTDLKATKLFGAATPVESWAAKDASGSDALRHAVEGAMDRGDWGALDWLAANWPGDTQSDEQLANMKAAQQSIAWRSRLPAFAARVESEAIRGELSAPATGPSAQAAAESASAKGTPRL
jgi:hypothetical protein